MYLGKQTHRKKYSSVLQNNCLFNKTKLQQLFSSRRSSSFSPNFDYFESAQAFIPSKKALAFQKHIISSISKSKHKSVCSSKLQVHQLPSQIQKISKKQFQPIQSCDNNSVIRRGTVSYLKAKPMLPVNRNQVHKIMLKRASQRYIVASEQQEVTQQNNKSSRVKNIKMISRLKRSRFWEKTEIEEEPITAWNQYLSNQAQPDLL